MEVIVEARCRFCGDKKSLTFDKESLETWESGKGLIRNIFPDLSDDDRELFLTKTCGPCFDSMFPDEED